MKITGEIIVKNKYSMINGFYNGYSFVMNKRRKWGIINTSGEEICKPIYDDARYFSNGMAAVKLNGKWGFINEDGKLVVPIKYDDFRDYGREGFALVCSEGKWGLIDKQGKEVLPTIYEFIDWEKDGIATVFYNGCIGKVEL